MASTIIHTRIDSRLKKQAEEILKALGMTSAEAIRMFFAQIANKKRIPFGLDLATDDIPENYIEIKDENEFAKLIGLSSNEIRSSQSGIKSHKKGTNQD